MKSRERKYHNRRKRIRVVGYSGFHMTPPAPVINFNDQIAVGGSSSPFENFAMMMPLAAHKKKRAKKMTVRERKYNFAQRRRGLSNSTCVPAGRVAEFMNSVASMPPSPRRFLFFELMPARAGNKNNGKIKVNYNAEQDRL